MSILSAQLIKPKLSKTFTRLLFGLYLISLGLIAYASIFYWLKVCLIVSLSYYLACKTHYKTPCPELLELYVSMREWVLVLNNGAILRFDEAVVLIHNDVFQLIKLSNESAKKILVLFNDQISLSELRCLHVKSINSSRKRLILKKHMLK